MEKFAIGMLLGMVGGAVVTANNYKMRTLVKKGQREVQEKLDKLIDEKLQELENDSQELTETVQEKIEERKPKNKTAKKAKA